MSDRRSIAGWETPVYFRVPEENEFATLAREYQKVTNKCGVVDLSYKGKLEVRGPDSLPFIRYLLSTKPPEVCRWRDRVIHNVHMQFGGISQSLMLTKSGRIMAAMKILHHDQFSVSSKYMLLTDPENEARDMAFVFNFTKQDTVHFTAGCKGYALSANTT